MKFRHALAAAKRSAKFSRKAVYVVTDNGNWNSFSITTTPTTRAIAKVAGNGVTKING